MTVFEKIKIKDVDELAEWLDEYGIYDSSPWFKWWGENYCNKCEPEIEKYKDQDMEYGWCEMYGKCRFFQELDDIPGTKQIVKMWLESEA